MGKTITMNIRVRDYTSRVLGVIKEKYGLQDKGQALDKFADLYGEDFVDEEVKDEVVKEFIEISNRHIKKHGFKGLTHAELDKLFKGD